MCGVKIKHLLIAYLLSDISARNYPNRFMHVKAAATQSSDIFPRHSVVKSAPEVQHW